MIHYKKSHKKSLIEARRFNYWGQTTRLVYVDPRRLCCTWVDPFPLQFSFFRLIFFECCFWENTWRLNLINRVRCENIHIFFLLEDWETWGIYNYLYTNAAWNEYVQIWLHRLKLEKSQKPWDCRNPRGTMLYLIRFSSSQLGPTSPLLTSIHTKKGTRRIYIKPLSLFLSFPNPIPERR